jgi:O-antigen ligase
MDMRTNSLTSSHANTEGNTQDSAHTKKILFYLVLHVPLGLIMSRFSLIATAHALLTIGLGLMWAVRGRTEHAMYAAAYIAGAEVLWRMSGANVFWEMGKFAVIGIFVLTLLQNRRFYMPVLPVFYFVLLLPSALITLDALPLDEARQQISFTLSGPLSLMVCVAVFSQVRFTRAQLQQMYLFVAAPVLGILAIAMFSTIMVDAIRFTDESNFVTSGGFGPNQVSAALSAGALMVFFYWLSMRDNKRYQYLFIGLMLVLVVQSVLTFSRGGLYLIAGSVLTALFFLVRERTARLRVLVFSGILVFVSWLFLIPWLNDFTQGQIISRFQYSSMTGRDLIIQSDIQIWKDNPLSGVGPGMSAPLHALTFISAASHTEFTRMVAEHGMLGLISLILLVVMVVRGFFDANGSRNRAIVSALLVWVLLYMFANAMRLVMPGFFFGLALNYSFNETRAYL